MQGNKFSNLLAACWSKDRVETARPVVQRWLKFMTAYLRFTAGLLAPLMFMMEVIPSTMAFMNNYIALIDYTFLLVRGIGGTLLIIFGAWQIKNNAGPILLVLGLVVLGILALDPMTRFAFISFPMASTWLWFCMGTGITAILFAILHVIAINLSRRLTGHVFYKQALRGLQQHHRIAVAAIAVLALFGVAYLVLTNRSAGAVPITIHPKNYQMQFRFWGEYTKDAYLNNITYNNGTLILDSLSRHHAVIQNALFSVRDENNQTESFSPNYSKSDGDTINQTLYWFHVHAPGIMFQIYAAGIGYNSSGNYEGSIYTPAMIKRIVNICKDYNISNVIGLYSDWEGGLKVANHTRNDLNQVLLTDAFTYVRQYFPHWDLSCCSGTASYWDALDGDNDLQYFDRENIWNPTWDDYGPMIYRCGWPAPNADPYTYMGAYAIYANAKLLLGALRGNVSKAGFWIGITGDACYDGNYTVYEHGAPINFGNSTGFDNLCRDILILKSFGIPTVSFFKASNDTPPGQRDPHKEDFFSAYGWDALDRLNATVNGANSTKPFTIWSDPKFIMEKYEYRNDFLLDYDHVTFIPVAALQILAGIALAGTGIKGNWIHKKKTMNLQV